MPVLDSFLHDPLRSGGTIDTDAEHAVPVVREEPFQIRAARGLPISMRRQTRPVTHRVDHQLQAGKVVVLNRQSNLNPDNAGADAMTAVWNVSNPMQTHLADDGQDAFLAKAGIGTLLIVGGAIGLAAFLLSRG